MLKFVENYVLLQNSTNFLKYKWYYINNGGIYYEERDTV